jgi:hypothetical protein
MYCLMANGGLAAAARPAGGDEAKARLARLKAAAAAS